MAHELDNKNAIACRKMFLESGSQILGLGDFTSASLSGLLEAYLSNEVGRYPENFARDEDNNIARVWNRIHLAKSESDRTQLRALPVSNKPEFFSLASTELMNRESLRSLQLSTYLQQFSKSVSNAGYSSSFARALSGVMKEMCENVLQHSRIVGDAGLGLVGFHAFENTVTFSVIDTGIGILESLRQSETWSALESEEAAMHAIVEKQASSKFGLGEGEGFKELFQALLDRNSRIWIRSNDGMVTMNSNGDRREAIYGSCSKLSGVHVCFSCSRDNDLGKSTIFN